MQLHLKVQLPAAAHASTGGPEFYLWCRANETRAAARRDSVARGWNLYERGLRDADPYRGGLLLAQRLGVALEDLARLLLAFQADDPWGALRGARAPQLDEVFDTLSKDPEAARRTFRLPSPETVESSKLPKAAHEPLLQASEKIARRWHRQLVGCASAWLLLHRLSKAMRHGSPLLPRPLIDERPGAGALGDGVQAVEGPWVMLIPTADGVDASSYITERSLVDLRDATLRRTRQAGLDAVALARQLAGLHVTRSDTGSVFALPNDALADLPRGHRRMLTELSRG